MTLAAGRLRDRVMIQAKSVTRDAYGGEIVTWGTLATVWALVESLSGREYLAANQGVDQARSLREVRVVIRPRDDVVPWHRVVHGSRLLEIAAVIPKGLDEMHLLCIDVNEETS